MICRKCRQDMKKGLKYCTYCGNRMKIELSEIILNVIYTVVTTSILFYTVLKNPSNNLVFFYILIALLVFLNTVALTNSYNKNIMSLSMKKNLLISIITYSIFYFFTYFFRGYVDVFINRTLFFTSIIVLLTFIKKYEIKHFILTNYIYFKEKCSK